MPLSSLMISLYVLKKMRMSIWPFEGCIASPQGTSNLAKYTKCEFWLRSVLFLGHITSEGIEVYQKKMEAIINWPRPLAPTNI